MGSPRGLCRRKSSCPAAAFVHRPRVHAQTDTRRPPPPQAVARNIESSLSTYPAHLRSSVVLLFSAHSLPMSVVNRGDPYPSEVGATVSAIMQRLGHTNPYRLVWQSQVGPSAWLGPQTIDAIKGLGEKGHNEQLLIPVAFTSDHIETLFELDLEYLHEAKEVSRDVSSSFVVSALTSSPLVFLRFSQPLQMGLTGVKRCDSLNDSPFFIKAIADIAASHLKSVEAGAPSTSRQMGLRCPGCTNEKCGEQKKWFKGFGQQEA